MKELGFPDIRSPVGKWNRLNAAVKNTDVHIFFKRIK